MYNSTNKTIYNLARYKDERRSRAPMTAEQRGHGVLVERHSKICEAETLRAFPV